MMNRPGTLYLVATPIGNLEDITLRALRVLKEADGILCEDTRQTIKLLNHYEIKNHLSAYHKFNEKDNLKNVLDRLKKGENLALVSDAGLPLISDPGNILVTECRAQGIPVEVIPGANAALSALQLSGLDASRFTFFGFSRKDKKGRKDFIKEILNCNNTAIVYESPHQLLKTLEAIKKEDPKRLLSISREITKKFEETVNGTPEELIDYFTQNPAKGEFVLVIEKGNTNNPIIDKTIEDLYEELTKSGLTDKEAIKKIASLKNLPKREVYNKIKIE